jgi:hypothetical protein
LRALRDAQQRELHQGNRETFESALWFAIYRRTTKSLLRVRHGGFDDAVKFEQRLVVKHDVIELCRSDARFGEAVVSGVTRQSRVVFLARKSFFLGRCDYLAVFD